MPNSPASIPAAPAPARSLSTQLSTGTLNLEIAREDLPFETLCGLAARRNPKRGFLFVSKVLGRHYAARPSLMRRTYRLLAERIPADLPGPVVFVGLAETAVCLGAGLHEEYLRIGGRTDVLYVHSTRYRLASAAACEFQEEHSHASRHLIHEPASESDRQLFRNARSVVLVDDEASTGKTFINLATALAPVLPHVGRAVCAVLTDWRGPARAAECAERMPFPSTFVSLLEGCYSFEPRAGVAAEVMPDVTGNGEPKDHLLRGNFGRLGVSRPARFSATPPPGPVVPGQRVLVLGTGEFVYPPFRLAEDLETAGADVYCQATTRSPIRIGDSIGSAISFPDNYGDGIENFLYNVRPGDYDRIYACYETPPGATQERLAELMGAAPVVMKEAVPCAR